MSRLTICSDGGVRRNGRYGAIGYVLASDCALLHEHAELREHVTTAEMEIRAAHAALIAARERYPDLRFMMMTDFEPLVLAITGGAPRGTVIPAWRHRPNRARHKHGTLLTEIRALLRVGDEVRWVPRNGAIFLSRAHDIVDAVLAAY